MSLTVVKCRWGVGKVGRCLETRKQEHKIVSQTAAGLHPGRVRHAWTTAGTRVSSCLDNCGHP